ncbi:MAG TPA: type II secretion system protein [Fimbriimonadaceae bacterium]|nr:type II secretion system protein [Fimbriimonadaceae bacterium]
MKRGNSLVGLLVVIAIIAILAVVFMRGNNTLMAPGTGSPRADGKGTTVPGLIMAKAKDDVCIEHLRDLRMALSLAHDTDGDEKWPATLQDTKQGAEFYKCPIGGEPYKYNPETGEVKCVHPGHEKY